jgi:hypothetical protein
LPFQCSGRSVSAWTEDDEPGKLLHKTSFNSRTSKLSMFDSQNFLAHFLVARGTGYEIGDPWYTWNKKQSTSVTCWASAIGPQSTTHCDTAACWLHIFLWNLWLRMPCVSFPPLRT